MPKKTQTFPLLYIIAINKAQSIRLAAYGTLLLFLAFGFFAWLTNHASEGSFNPAISLAVFVATMVAHEAVHGLFLKIFGGTPKFGVGILYYFFVCLRDLP